MNAPGIRRLALRGLAVSLALASAPTSAQDFFFPGDRDPNDLDTTAKVRCWYQAPRADSALATAYVEAADFTLKGGWANLAPGPTADVFFTKETPAAIRQACERSVRATHLAGAVVDWNAVERGDSLNHHIWHSGDLSPGAAVERIVAFGDSLSDTGNLYNHLGWTFPNRDSWFLGRFSNGPVWTEYLAKRTGKTLYNWAVGGARTEDAHVFVSGLGSQVESFRKYAALDKAYDPSRTLFTVMVGANDFMNDENENWKQSAEDYLGDVEKALAALGDLGARKVLLSRLPDISRTPEYQDLADARDALRNKVLWFNEYLSRAAFNASRVTGAQIRLVHVDEKFNTLLDNPAAFGMRDTVGNCLGIIRSDPSNYTRHHGALRCDPATTVFWDRVHPTTRVHEIMAEWALDATDPAWGLR